MSREIYTYSDLKDLKSSKSFNEINKYPIITVSSDLKKALKGTMTYDKVDGLFTKDSSVIATEFHNVASGIDNVWNSDSSKFNRLVILSGFIRNKIDKSKDENEKKWLTGCMRNISSLMSTIIMLEQVEVEPNNLEANGDKNIELLVEAWTYLRKNDKTIERYHENIEKLKEKKDFNDVFNRAFNTSISYDKYEKIVFMGFYYMTPYQERVIKQLEAVGFSLVFLFSYDGRYPFVHEIWDKTYCESNGFPGKDKWHIEEKSEKDPYAEIFEGADSVKVKNNIVLKEYSSVMEFVNDSRKLKNDGYSLYSAGYKKANEILRDYFPEEYGERKILSYPIGQFISTLNKMWDEEKQSIVLDVDNLIDCFSSGWLSVDGISGKQYLQQLVYLIPFFKGCKTIKEWEKRLDLLNEIIDNAVNTFEGDYDAEESVERWQRAVGNPLINFSMFAVEKEKSQVVLKLIKQLFEMAKELFSNNHNVNVSEHINKLDIILRKYELSNEMYSEERKIVGDIFEKLSDSESYIMDCTPSDISRALDLFMSGKFDDGEIQNNGMGMIYPLFFVDAACVKNNSKVHICFSDVHSLPGGKKDYVWPLTEEVIRNCQRKTNNPLLANVIEIMESDALCNRFFVYTALKNSDVTFSWIKNVNDKILSPSPYIKLISSVTGISIKGPKRNEISYQRVADSYYGAGKVEEYSFDNAPQSTVKEARMDYALCPMKYLLGYVLEKYPTFQSEFQQNYAMNALISSIYDLMKDDGMTVDEVYENVILLFPQLRKTEKRQIKDYIRYDQRDNDTNYSNRSECGGKYYTDERLRIHYPNQDVRGIALQRFNRLYTPDGRKGLNLYEVMETTDMDKIFNDNKPVSVACQYCPHISYCRNAKYAGNQEDYYD